MSVVSAKDGSAPILVAHQVQPKQNKKSLGYVVRSLVAGGVAGSLAKTATAPLDRIKILFQGSKPAFQPYMGSISGVFKALAYIWREEGIRGCYRGHSAMLLRVFPYASLNYMCYEQYKHMLIPDEKKEKPLMRLVAGSMAGTTSVFFTYPLDLVRAKLAYQVAGEPHHFRGILHAITHTYHTHGGIRGLYQGFVPTALGIVPYAGISFYSYEAMKKICNTTLSDYALNEDGSIYLPARLLLGGMAGALAQTASYPLDVVRRRMQLQTQSPTLVQYKGTWDALKGIARTSGVRGLFVGLSINYVKVAPSTSISFVSYEFMKKHLGISGGRNDV